MFSPVKLCSSVRIENDFTRHKVDDFTTIKTMAWVLCGVNCFLLMNITATSKKWYNIKCHNIDNMVHSGAIWDQIDKRPAKIYLKSQVNDYIRLTGS